MNDGAAATLITKAQSARRNRVARYRSLLGSLCLGGGVLFAPRAALAHAMLEQASPAAGAVVHGTPKRVTLSFSEALEPAFSNIAVNDVAGHDVAAAPSSVSGTKMEVALRPLRPGSYRVTWHALSVDTHRTQGAFSFTVAP